ncbi:MAG: hypothetical protein ACI9HK_001995 [Pirellulaceae bacterium]|jgi:hypothetical protein
MRTITITAIVIITATVYALVRYVVFKGVAVDHLPLYVFNKIASFAGIVLIGWAPWLKDVQQRKQMGLVAFSLLIAHVAMSWIMMNPAYYPKLYQEAGKLNWRGELSMLAGVVALVMILWLFRVTPVINEAGAKPTAKTRPAGLVPGLGRLVLLFTALHVFFMGFSSWADVANWPGYLPPITLLSFVIGIGFVASRMLR